MRILRIKIYEKTSLISFFFLFLFSANVCFAAEVGGTYNVLIKAGMAAALLAIIWGGIRYVLSIGDPHLASEAKTWIISGFTGLAILVCANFIITKVTGKPPVLEITGEIPTVEVPALPERPGIHFYSDPDCSIEIFVAPDVRSIKIVNDPDTEFVVVLKNGEDECEVYLNPGCHSLPLNFSPALTYSYQFNFLAEGKIEFFRRPYYSGKKYKLEDVDISRIRSTFALSNFIINDGDCVSMYNPNTSCLGSIKFSGPYTLVLYNEEGKCEVYEPGLIEKEWGGAEKNIKIHRLFSQSKPFKITVIPIKR